MEEAFSVRFITFSNGERYPLLQSIGYSVSSNAVAEYINLIDQSKGV